ncbi:MAG: polysaccharide deacetylase family protein [Desulfitobacteriaceae bacterium]
MAKKIVALVILIITIILFSEANYQSLKANALLPGFTGEEPLRHNKADQTLSLKSLEILSRSGNRNGPEALNSETSAATGEVPPVTNSSSDSKTVATDDVLKAAGLPAQTALKNISIPVVYYHAVKTVPKNQLCMPPEQLEEQMKYLYDNQFQSVNLNELYDFYYGNGTLPDKPIVITFDDGYKDNYTNALPILSKYGFTATVFVTVGQDGSDFLTREEMKELLEAGWEIESHTMTHPELSKLDQEKLKWELQKSKEVLERDLGQEVKFLAYPYGDFNDAVIKTAQEAGYLMAFTTHAGWSVREMNPLRVSRVYLYANMGLKEFARRIENPEYTKNKK